MPAGAPRTISPSKEEVIELGKDLVEWAKKDTDKKIMFSEWYAIEKHMIRKHFKALIKLDEFRPYYEEAQAILGKKYLDGTINPSVGHRVMWHYVPDSRDQEIEKMEIAHEMKKEEINHMNLSDPQWKERAKRQYEE